jgi:hypothetical protein
MNKLFTVLALTLALSGSALLAANNAHALVIIDQVTDHVTVGDFEVFGNDVASGTGQNYEVLKFKPSGSSTSASSCDGCALDTAPHADVSLGDLWSHLNANGIVSTDILGFGFDVNQNTAFVDIDSLSITIAGTTYSTNDVVRVSDGLNGNGSSTAEARFIIHLGYDFMTAYNASSTTLTNFTINGTHSSANGGFEEYFLSSVFSSTNPPPTSAVPEPASMLLMGSGLFGTVFLRRKK